jgi:hypothetical protein
VVAVVVEVVDDVARLVERLVEPHLTARDGAVVILPPLIDVGETQEHLARSIQRVPAEGDPVHLESVQSKATCSP